MGLSGNGSSCGEEEEGARVEEIQKHAVYAGRVTDSLRLIYKGKARLVVGRGEKSLRCARGSELLPGGREKRGAKIIEWVESRKLNK